MARICNVCKHPKRALIDAALVKQSMSTRAVAKLYGLSQSSVQRHFDAHVAGVLETVASSLVDEDEPTQPEQTESNHTEQALSTACKKGRAPQSFKQRVTRLMQIALCKKEDRLQLLDDDLQRLEFIRKERAEDMADVPGGKSGFLVRKYRSLGKVGVREEYELDRALLAERRAHAEQASRELGDRPDHRGGGGGGQVVILAPQIGPDHPLANIKPVEIQTIAGRVLPPPEDETPEEPLP